MREGQQWEPYTTPAFVVANMSVSCGPKTVEFGKLAGLKNLGKTHPKALIIR